MKPIWWVGLIVTQLLFIVYGVGLTIWTLNEWFNGEPINALFDGGIGVVFFFTVWQILRRWVMTSPAFEEVRRQAREARARRAEADVDRN